MDAKRGWDTSSDEDDGMAIDLDAKQDESHDTREGLTTTDANKPENQGKDDPKNGLDYDPAEPTDDYDPAEPTEGDETAETSQKAPSVSNYDPADPTLSDEEIDSHAEYREIKTDSQTQEENQDNEENRGSENKQDTEVNQDHEEDENADGRWNSQLESQSQEDNSVSPVVESDSLVAEGTEEVKGDSKSPLIGEAETEPKSMGGEPLENKNIDSQGPGEDNLSPGSKSPGDAGQDEVGTEVADRSRSPSLAPTDTDENTQASFADGGNSDVPEVTFDESDFVLEKDFFESGDGKDSKDSGRGAVSDAGERNDSEASHEPSPPTAGLESEKNRTQEEVDTKNEEVLVDLFREESDPDRIENDLEQPSKKTKKKLGVKKLKKKGKKLKKGQGKKGQGKQMGSDVEDQRFVELRGERQSVESREEGEVEGGHGDEAENSNWEELEDRLSAGRAEQLYDVSAVGHFDGDDEGEQREPGEIVEEGSKRKGGKKRDREKKRKKKSRREVATIEDGAQGDEDSQKFPSFLAGFFVQDEEGGEEEIADNVDNLTRSFEAEEERTFQKGGKTYRKRHDSGAEDSVKSVEEAMEGAMREENEADLRRGRGHDERRHGSRENRHQEGRDTREVRRDREHRHETPRDKERERVRDRDRSRHERDRLREKEHRGDREVVRDRERDRDRSRRGEREERRRRHGSRSGSRERRRRSGSAERNRRSRERAQRHRRRRSSRSQERERDRDRLRRSHRDHSRERDSERRGSARRASNSRSRSPRHRSERGSSNKENREDGRRGSRRRVVSRSRQESDSEDREARRSSHTRRQRRDRDRQRERERDRSSSSSSSSSASSSSSDSNQAEAGNGQRHHRSHRDHNSDREHHHRDYHHHSSSDEGASSDVILVEPEKIVINLDEEEDPPSRVDITHANAEDDSTTMVDGESIPPPPDLGQNTQASALIQITQEGAAAQVDEGDQDEGDATPTRDERSDRSASKRRSGDAGSKTAPESAAEGDYDPAHPTEEPEERDSRPHTPLTAAPAQLLGPSQPSVQQEESGPVPPSHPPPQEVRPSPPPVPPMPEPTMPPTISEGPPSGLRPQLPLGQFQGPPQPPPMHNQQRFPPAWSTGNRPNGPGLPNFRSSQKGLLPTPDMQPLFSVGEEGRQMPPFASLQGRRDQANVPISAMGPLAQLTSLLPALERAKMSAHQHNDVGSSSSSHPFKAQPFSGMGGKGPLMNSSGSNMRPPYGPRGGGAGAGDPTESTEVVDMDMSPGEDDCELELPSPNSSDSDRGDRRRRGRKSDSHTSRAANDMSRGANAPAGKGPIQPVMYLKALSKVIERLTPKGQPAGAGQGSGGSAEKSKGREHRKRRQPEVSAEDDVPASAVELTNKEKYLKKLHLQERVIDEVKLAIKPFYSSKKINKEQYKLILRKAVPKVCHSKSERINPQKIQQLVEAYVGKLAKKSGIGAGHSGHGGRRKKVAHAGGAAPQTKDGTGAAGAGPPQAVSRQNGERSKKSSR